MRFDDRVVHHALCNIIEPRFERLFISDSYANRVGKGRIGPSIGCKSFNFKNIEIIAV